MPDKSLRSKLIRLASVLPKGSDERRSLLSILAAIEPVELTMKPTQAEVSRAWPGITLNGEPVFKPYNAVVDEVEKRLQRISDQENASDSGQEAYLGYSTYHGDFVSGWDWWYKDEGMLTGYAVLRFENGRFRVTRVGYIRAPLYGGGNDGLNELKRKFDLDLDLRLD